MITAFYTCKRPVPYISQTLDSYFDFYTEQPIVFEQKGTDPYLNRTRVMRVDSLADSLISNWLFMCGWLHKNTQNSLYMLCEDDIVFRQRIILPPNIPSYLSPYCCVANKGGEGWHVPNMASNGLCGALCIILRREALDELMDNTEKFLQLTQGLHLDYAIGKFFNNGLVHHPTMVLHIGDVSTRETNNNPNHPLYDRMDIYRTPSL